MQFTGPAPVGGSQLLERAVGFHTQEAVQVHDSILPDSDRWEVMSRGTPVMDRLPEVLRTILLAGAALVALAAALAPIVYLLRRIGVG